MEEFARIKRLPPYVFNITGELKAAARKRGEDVTGGHAVGWRVAEGSQGG